MISKKISNWDSHDLWFVFVPQEVRAQIRDDWLPITLRLPLEGDTERQFMSEWLDEHCSLLDNTKSLLWVWEWLSSVKVRVYIKHETVAVLFKLRFG
jgi:hypothetical protein